MDAEPRDTEDEPIVAKLRDKGFQGLVMIIDRKVEGGKVGDVARFYWPAVDNFKDAGVLQLVQGEMVMAGKRLVYESNASRATVNQRMGGDLLGSNGEGARYNKMISFH